MVVVRSVVSMPVKHRSAGAAVVITVIIAMQSVAHHSNWNIVYIYQMGVVVVVRISIIIARLCSRGSQHKERCSDKEGERPFHIKFLSTIIIL